MITSSSNPQLKNIVQLNQKAKARREQGLYVVEGYKMYREAPKEQIKKVYVSSRFLEKHPEIRKEHPDAEEVEDRIFASVSDTRTPQGILCVMHQQSWTLEKMLEKENPLLMILEDLQDPGNVGTIFRTAEGAGVDGIILTKNSVDIYNPKTIRSTMGSVYRVPFLYTDRIVEVLGELMVHDVRTFAAHLNGERDYDREDYRKGTAFFIGNEGNGLSDELAGMADRLIKIPMGGQLESLNAAMAAGILMYESSRQRRHGCGDLKSGKD